jgi:hypothetical protein
LATDPSSIQAPRSVQAGSARLAGRGRLISTLGIGFGIAVAIGNTIGAGIVRAPGEIAGFLPSTWLYFAIGYQPPAALRPWRSSSGNTLPI